MKTIIKDKLGAFLQEAKQETGLKLLSSVEANLDNVQKRIMVKRILLFSISGLYILLFTGILKVSGLPGITANFDQLGPFSTLNNIFLCALPVVYVTNHYLMIHTFIYRSQMRLLQHNLIKTYYPEIHKNQLNHYVQPYSPGMNIKNLHHLNQSTIPPTKEDTKEGQLRLIAKNGEAILTWIIIPIGIIFNFYQAIKMYNTTGRWEEATLFVIGIILSLIIVIIGTIGLIKQYNPSFKLMYYKSWGFHE